MSEVISSGIIEAKHLKQFVGTLTPLVQEARIHFNDDGLLVNVNEAANVAMYRPLRMDRAQFESYDSPGAATVGINLHTLSDRINSASSDDLIELQLDMEKRDLIVTYGPVKHRVSLIDPDSIRKEPNLNEDLYDDLVNVVTLKSDLLDTAIKNVDMVTDVVEFAADIDGECVNIIGEGDTDDVTISLGQEETSDPTDLQENHFTLLHLEYVKEFVSPIPSGVNVTLRFGDQFPVIFEWQTEDGLQEATGLIAPRIDTDRQ